MSDGAKTGGTHTKLIAGIFGAVVAPIIVGVAIQQLTKDDKPADKPAEKPADKPPEEPAKLFKFTGKELTGAYTWLIEEGKDKDPKKVFSLKDDMLRISGEEIGYLATQREYENYAIEVEYKWGEKTWPPHEAKARRASITVHATGADGDMVGYEVLMGEGLTGDIYSHKGRTTPLKITSETNPNPPPAPKPPAKPIPWGTWFKGGKRTVLDTPSVLTNKFVDPNRKDEKGFRGKFEHEKPHGEWNTLRLHCSLLGINVFLNGEQVNGARDPSTTKGKILIKSRQSEIFFRKIDITLLN